MTEQSAASSEKDASAALEIYVPSEEAQKLFKEFLDDARKRQLSSSENFDKAILTYSSGGLALSLAFLKDFIPIRTAKLSFLLYGSWSLFVLATALTILSFLVSYRAQTLSILFAQKYYLEGSSQYLNKMSWCDLYTRWSNRFAGGAFILALIFTSVFVAINLNEANQMSEKKDLAVNGVPAATMQKMTNVPTATPLQKGLPASIMTPLPPSAMPSAAGSAPQTTPTSTSNAPSSGQTSE